MSADEHSLRFNWLIGGIDSSVDIRVEPDGPNSSIVSLTHSVRLPGGNRERSSLGLMRTSVLSLGNRVDQLAGRGVAHRRAFTSCQMRAALENDAPRWVSTACA